MDLNLALCIAEITTWDLQSFVKQEMQLLAS